MSRVLHHDPDLDALPVPLRDIVAECLAKAPSARPTSQDLLLRLLDGETASAPAPARATAAVPPSGATATKLLEKTAAPETTATRPPAPRPRRKPLVLAVAASTAVLLSAGGATLWLNRDHPARSPFSIPAYAQDALRHAGPAYNTMNTFDYRALDADVRKAGSVETASYQRARADTLDRFEDDARARNLTVTTTTTTTGLVQAAPDRVTVLVDAKVTTNENGRTTDANARARLLLVHQNGSWLVDKADAINRDIIKNDPTGVQWPAPAASRLLNTARSCATSEILNSRNPTNLGGCADPTFTKQWPTLNKQLAALLQTPKTANITLPAMETGLISARTANDATVIVAANVGAAVLNQTFPTKTVQLRMTMKRSGDRWLITHESLS